jgi:hypothetical protein
MRQRTLFRLSCGSFSRKGEVYAYWAHSKPKLPEGTKNKEDGTPDDQLFDRSIVIE